MVAKFKMSYRGKQRESHYRHHDYGHGKASVSPDAGAQSLLSWVMGAHGQQRPHKVALQHRYYLHPDGLSTRLTI